MQTPCKISDYITMLKTAMNNHGDLRVAIYLDDTAPGNYWLGFKEESDMRLENDPMDNSLKILVLEDTGINVPNIKNY